MVVKKYLFLLISLLGILACKKNDSNKGYTCSITYYPLPAYLVFVGFSTSEADTMIVEKYKARSSFALKVRTDTFYRAPLTLRADTLVDQFGNIHFGFFEHGYDYRIIFKGLNKYYDLTALTSGQLNETYQQNEPCNNKGTFVKPMESMNINQTPAAKRLIAPNVLAFILTK